MHYERSDLLIFLVPFVVSMVGRLILQRPLALFIVPALVMTVEDSPTTDRCGNSRPSVAVPKAPTEADPDRRLLRCAPKGAVREYRLR